MVISDGAPVDDRLYQLILVIFRKTFEKIVKYIEDKQKLKY